MSTMRPTKPLMSSTSIEYVSEKIEGCKANTANLAKWGSTGVFINDMRGNRITTKGEQRPHNPIMNDKQWVRMFFSFLNIPNFILGCIEEIPRGS
jgi:hypothetical protein